MHKGKEEQTDSKIIVEHIQMPMCVYAYGYMYVGLPRRPQFSKEGNFGTVYFLSFKFIHQKGMRV